MRDKVIRQMLLLLLLSLSVALPAVAAKDQVYTIKKGDTLWGLSKRFIDDPQYWPDMWANNPEISNPHLIFPGQKVRVTDGRLEIIPAYPEAEETVAAPAEQVAENPQAAVENSVQIKAAGSGDGFILTDEEPLGILVDSVDNRVLLTKGDLVFLKMQDPDKVTVGDTYSIYGRGEEIKHPQTDKVIGTMMHDLGFLQVTDVSGPTVTAKIGDVYREVTRGAELYDYVPPRKEITLQAASQDLSGTIVATQEGKLTQGTNDVVFLDLGSDDALAVGNMLYISRPRQVSDELYAKAGTLELPDEVLGAAVVTEVKPETAAALIIKCVDAISIGDRVTAVKN